MLQSIYRYFFVLFLLIILIQSMNQFPTINPSQQLDYPQQQFSEQNQDMMQTYESQHQFFNDQIFDMPDWIIEQNQQTSKHSQQYENMILQSFKFMLKKGQESIYKWNPSKNQQLIMQIEIKFIGEYGDLDYPYGKKSEFLQIFSKRTEKSTYYYLEKVYFHKRIQVNFDSDYKIIKFLNLYDSTLVVEVSLEWVGNVIKQGVKDQEFEVLTLKMTNLLDHIKNVETKNQGLFTLERSRFEEQQRHHEKYTLLTGIQLFVILSTSVLQIYYIEKLLENRVIV